MRKKLFAHTHAGIVDDKAQGRAVFAPSALGGGKGDLSALPGKFDGIAQNVDQHLLQLHGVADIIVVEHRVDDALVLHPFGRRLGITNGIDAADEILRGDFIVL